MTVAQLLANTSERELQEWRIADELDWQDEQKRQKAQQPSN